jgi:hypothetical protein
MSARTFETTPPQAPSAVVVQRLGVVAPTTEWLAHFARPPCAAALPSVRSLHSQSDGLQYAPPELPDTPPLEW